MCASMPPSDHVVANMHVGRSGLRELASGVDALYLSGRAELPKRFLARLEDCRSWAAEAKRPRPCEIGELLFGIAPHGWGKYRFCLDHAMARIGFSTSRHLPTVRVQPRSEFLHAVGPEAAVATLREVLSPELRRLALLGQPGRPLRRLAGLEARPRRRPALRLPGRRTAHLRGRRHPDRLRVRQPQDQDVPGPPLRQDGRHGRQGQRLVARGLGRALRARACPSTGSSSRSVARDCVEFDLNTPAQVLAAAGDLWAYATGEWLTYRSPTADQTRSRWPLAPEWLARCSRPRSRHQRRRPRPAATAPGAAPPSPSCSRA